MEFAIQRGFRKNDEMRAVSIEPGILPLAEGSCLIKFGNTHLICTASVESQVPHFIKNTGRGWVTAEYGMLPRSTGTRMQREAARGKQDGRTQEIQRLIGRSLRSIIDLSALGERQIIIDCDVIRADGGTRTAAINGGCVALVLACNKLLKNRVIKSNPIRSLVSAVSCGIVNGASLLDLEYLEDSNAEVDANFVMTEDNKFVEIQMTAEKSAFSDDELDSLKKLAKDASKELFKIQKKAIG